MPTYWVRLRLVFDDLIEAANEQEAQALVEEWLRDEAEYEIVVTPYDEN